MLSLTPSAEARVDAAAPRHRSPARPGAKASTCDTKARPSRIPVTLPEGAARALADLLPRGLAPLRAGAPSRGRCACGGALGAGGECATCRSRRLSRRLAPGAPAGKPAVPRIVHDVLRELGSPLDAATRTAMEQRFGHDFRDVRIHTDHRAAQSARAVDAAAYVVGRHVVFGEGQYRPTTAAGTSLLAHELAHAVQQRGAGRGGQSLSIGSASSPLEREADAAAHDALRGRAPKLQAGVEQVPVIRRQCGGKPLPPCETGYVSVPSDSAIGSAVGQWIGLQYRQSRGVSSYMLVDWWVYGARGKTGTIGSSLLAVDPYVLGALQATPDWGRSGTQRVDILDSDRDEVYEIKPVRGASAGPAQLAGYLASLRAVAPRAPDWMGSRPREWHAGVWEPEPYSLQVPGRLGQLCYLCTWLDPGNAGVILYDLLCCEHGHAPPIYVPKEAVDELLERAKEFLNRLAHDVADALGVAGKIVAAAAAVIALVALAIFLLPEEVIAGIIAFLAAVGTAIVEAFGAAAAAAGTMAGQVAGAATALTLGGAVANAATSPPQGRPESQPRQPSHPAGGAPRLHVQPPGKVKTAPAPAVGVAEGLVAHAIDVLQAIERAPSRDPRAAELKRLATAVLGLAQGRGRAPAQPTRAPGARSKPAVGGHGPDPTAPYPSEVPGLTSVPKVPEHVAHSHGEFCLVEGINSSSVPREAPYSASVVAHFPGRDFGADAKLRVISNDRRTLVLEFAEDWWIPGMGGAYKGRRFTQAAALIGKCGTVYAPDYHR